MSVNTDCSSYRRVDNLWCLLPFEVDMGKVSRSAAKTRSDPTLLGGTDCVTGANIELRPHGQC
jgi:hypothetical protein